MKIGILTFHWATNYGAVLQAYALQTVLERFGHSVYIINYKPTQFEYNLWTFIRQHHFLRPVKFFRDCKKERRLTTFRQRYLHQTVQIRRYLQLDEVVEGYDVLITGSDQVMNPGFLRTGERGGSTAYFLDCGRPDLRRIAYAASFGTTNYPESLIKRVRPLIARFEQLSVRERSGLAILEAMGRNDAMIVPDPTLVLKRRDYDELIGHKSLQSDNTVIYMLHNRTRFITKLIKNNCGLQYRYCIDNGITEWLDGIRSARQMITNSFHGVVFCLLFHVPFAVVLPQIENVGMNDRFYTLLCRCDLLDRIITENDFDLSVFQCEINWQKVDRALDEYRQVGMEFLKNIN